MRFLVASFPLMCIIWELSTGRLTTTFAMALSPSFARLKPLRFEAQGRLLSVGTISEAGQGYYSIFLSGFKQWREEPISVCKMCHENGFNQ